MKASGIYDNLFTFENDSPHNSQGDPALFLLRITITVSHTFMGKALGAEAKLPPSFKATEKHTSLAFFLSPASTHCAAPSPQTAASETAPGPLLW